MSDKNNVIDLEKEFALDEDKLSRGVWVPYKNAKFLIASTSSVAWENSRDLFFMKYPQAASRESEQVQIEYEALIARHILLGWEGFKQQYSYEEAKKMLRLPGIRKWVMQVAGNDNYFKPVSNEDIIKN